MGARHGRDSTHSRTDNMSRELRASIARGLADANAGRLVSVEDLMKEFGIDE